MKFTLNLCKNKHRRFNGVLWLAISFYLFSGHNSNFMRWPLYKLQTIDKCVDIRHIVVGNENEEEDEKSVNSWKCFEEKWKNVPPSALIRSFADVITHVSNVITRAQANDHEIKWFKTLTSLKTWFQSNLSLAMCSCCVSTLSIQRFSNRLDRISLSLVQ